MDNQIRSNQRIAKNVMFMYFRMLITLIVGLLTARIVLSTLGASDYGLYNVVGGIIVILASINGTLTSGTQRFISYSLGEDDAEKTKRVFSTALLLHIMFAGFILILSETVGLWFLIQKMNIPEGRETAAFWVYQFSVIATLINIVQVPYSAAMVAHERLNIYAYMSIYTVVARLLIVYLIQVFSGDKLIFYAGLICVIDLIAILIYNVYCRHYFVECRQLPKMHKKVFKEMANFSGWNIFGSMVVPLQNQGINILLNIFFNTILNAARGIAINVNTMVMQFVNNFQVAVNPQIVKLYAAGEKEEMIKLVINNSKFAGFLYLFIAVPLFVNIEFVLDIWLGEYPEYTVPFVRIILFQSLIQTLARPVVMVVHAVGKMGGPNLTAGVCLMAIVPVSYLLLRMGVGPITVFLVNLIPWFLETFFNLFFEKKYVGFPMWGFYKKVYMVVFPIALLMVLVPTVAFYYMPFDGWRRFLVVCSISVVTSALCIFYLGLNKSLRKTVIIKLEEAVHTKFPFMFSKRS